MMTPNLLTSTILRRNAVTIATGVAGVSTLTLLAAGSLALLFAGGMTTAARVAWLGGLGSNALANWLDQWARANLACAIGNDRDTEQQLMEALARDLQAQFAANDTLATDVATLLERTQAIPTVLDALQGQGALQVRLLRRLVEDLQSITFRNQRQHDITLCAVEAQGAALHDVIVRSDATLLAEIRTLQPGDAIQGDKVLGDKVGDDKVLGDKITSGGISIRGSVGTLQNLTITGGTVQGSIIGSQTTYYSAAPVAPSASTTSVNQEDIDEQQELLYTHRRTLAVYLRRLAKLSDAHAPPEITHGIREARAGIQRVKATLRGWRVAIADHPDDAAEL